MIGIAPIMGFRSQMPTHQVNLDALIPREDFAAPAESVTARTRMPSEMKLSELHGTQTSFLVLRKPDFQRETANWNPKQVFSFIRSFIDGDLIPSLIMWRSPITGNHFVIDGAHRLSALIAWVQDDYGDKERSFKYFGTSLTAEQITLAEATRKLINSSIGSFQWLANVIQHPELEQYPGQVKRAKNVTFPIQLQWVEGNEAAAENSFYVINGSATLIDETEMAVIKARRKPNAIATRALMRAGTGLKYHLSFPDESIAEIDALAREIYDLLFTPTQARGPIKTTDLPIASRSYTPESFKMLFDLVNLVNRVTPKMWKDKQQARRKNAADIIPDDQDGSATIKYLKEVRRAALLITGDDRGSLGLHPIVYTYDGAGKFQPTAFLSIVSFAIELSKTTAGFMPFTEVRRDFEDYLIKHRHFVNHLGRSYGSRTRPLEAITKMYSLTFDMLSNGQRDHQTITTSLVSDPKLKKLAEVISKSPTVETDEANGNRKKFSKEVKSSAYLRDAVDTPIPCRQCGARLHSKSMSADHTSKKADGGAGTSDNLQWMHPFCNTGHKNSGREAVADEEAVW